MKTLLILILLSNSAFGWVLSKNRLTEAEEAELEDYEKIVCGIPYKNMGYVSFPMPYGQCKKGGGYVIDYILGRKTEYEKKMDKESRKNMDWSH